MVTEHKLQNEILAALNSGGVRLFRINSGIAWQGEVVMTGGGILMLRNYRKVQLAPKGTPDLYGFRQYNGIAQYGVLEVKIGRGKVTKEQQAHIDLVIRKGGFGGVVYSVEQAYEIINAK